MTRDPFLRLALIALVSLYVAALAVLERLLGWPTAVCALVGGIGGALLLTLVREPDQQLPDPRRRRRQPREGTDGFERVA